VLLVIGIVALWSVWILVPLASLALVVWLVVLAVLLLVGWRRRAGTHRVNEQRVSE
jgi:membrane protein implicated in regulation of membrane protease activity